jgi:ferredoxin
LEKNRHRPGEGPEPGNKYHQPPQAIYKPSIDSLLDELIQIKDSNRFSGDTIVVNRRSRYMPTKTVRKIVKIDQEKCDGCGQCVPSCHEGAIKMVNGKAQLAGENLCDGLGACLGQCPRGAITIEERPAEDFDQQAVNSHLATQAHAPVPIASCPTPAGHGHGGGCPGSQMRMLQPRRPQPVTADSSSPRPSQLGQWPVQLALVPPAGPMWQDAHVLIAADCVPFACPEFHEKMLAGKSLAIACPKLDNMEPYLHKLSRILADNNILSITVAHMQVPCCSGIVRLVRAAMELSGRTDIPFVDITVGVDGSLMTA